MRRIGLRAGATVLAISAIAAASASARTWRVAADGSADALTIQAGVDSAVAGDSVLVAPGTYVEGVSIEEPIALIGEQGAAVTTLDRGGVGECIVVRSLGLPLVEGLRLVGAEWSGYGYVGGRAVDAYSVELSNCIIDAPRGVTLAYTDATVADCEFLNGSPITFWSQTPTFTGKLILERCRFSGDQPQYFSDNPSVVHVFDGAGSIAEVRGCVFERAGGGKPLVGYQVNPGVSMLVEDCLFVENEGPAVAYAPIPVSRSPGGPTDAILTIRRNTVVRAADYSLTRPYSLSPWSTIEQNCVVGGLYGIWVPDNGAQATIACNLVWGNGTNWLGIPDPTGTNGNISEAPKFCDGPGGDYTVAENSPLLPANNSCGVQIGSFGQGCGPLLIEPASWGRIKGWYRE